MPYLTPNAPPANEFVSRRILIPNDIDFLGIVNGQIYALTKHWLYEQFGELTPQETADYMSALYTDYQNSSGFMLGTIVPYATAEPPTYMLPCDGSTYARADWPTLYAALDPVFWVDDDYFTVPNIPAGHSVVQVGTSPSLNEYNLGASGGNETHTQNTNELATHSHIDIGHQHTIGNTIEGLAVAPGELPVLVPIPLIPGFTGVASASLNDTGLGQPMDIMNPWTALKYGIIAR